MQNNKIRLPLRKKRLLYGYKFGRVKLFVIISYFKMTVRTGTVSGAADKRYRLALLNNIALIYEKSAAMRIIGNVAVAVVDFNQQPV